MILGFPDWQIILVGVVVAVVLVSAIVVGYRSSRAIGSHRKSVTKKNGNDPKSGWGNYR